MAHLRWLLRHRPSPTVNGGSLNTLLYYIYVLQINIRLLLDEKSEHSFDAEMALEKVRLTLQAVEKVTRSVSEVIRVFVSRSKRPRLRFGLLCYSLFSRPLICVGAQN